MVVALAITLLLTTIAPLYATAADSAAGSATGDLSGAFGDWRYSARTNEGKQFVAAYSRVRDRDAITRASTQVFNGKMPDERHGAMVVPPRGIGDLMLVKSERL